MKVSRIVSNILILRNQHKRDVFVFAWTGDVYFMKDLCEISVKLFFIFLTFLD